MRQKNRILNFHSRFEFPAMLVVCGWSIWTPPVIRVDTHPHIAVLRHRSPNLIWVSFELIWGVIWAHMRCHLSSYETSFELIWAHLISNNLIWYQITSNDTSYELIWDIRWDVKWDQTRLGRGRVAGGYVANISANSARICWFWNFASGVVGLRIRWIGADIVVGS